MILFGHILFKTRILSHLLQELVGKLALPDIDTSTISEKGVVDEIFNSTLREIADEVNVPLDRLTDPKLIGIARNTTSAGRPSSEYYVR